MPQAHRNYRWQIAAFWSPSIVTQSGCQLSREYRDDMDEELDYLWETLGLEITAIPWPDRHKIHPTLRPAITVMQATYRGASFLMMRMAWHATLPDLKRVQASLVELSIRYSRRDFGDPFGAMPTRPFASAANPVHLPRHSGISALYGRRVLERQAQQTGKDLRSA